MLNKKPISVIRLLGLLLLLPLSAYAQEEIDTSAYLPDYYYGALDYNLMIASSLGYESEVTRLLENGADVTAKTAEGATALIFAVANNHLSAAKILINNEADVNTVTSSMETPLMIAVKNENVEIAEALIRAGADIDFSNHRGVTSLHFSSIYGFFYITDLLIYYRADIDKKTEDGTTSLMAAIWAGNAEVADLLIQNGANMEARDNQGFTPFQIAAQNGDTVIMKMLIKHGVNIYAKNNYNWDALILTISTEKIPALKLLLKEGNAWTSPERKALDPYLVASKYRRTAILEILTSEKVPGNVKKGIDQMGITVSSKLNMKDIYTGLALSFKEPLINSGFVIGMDTKLWYTRVLLEKEENLIYQYLDKSSIVYAGLFKDFPIYEKFKTGLSFSTTVAVGYSFGNKLKGTEIPPANKYMLMPSANLKLNLNNIVITAGAEYMKSDFYNISPIWFRAGLTYNYFFDRVRAPLKMIKWY